MSVPDVGPVEVPRAGRAVTYEVTRVEVDACLALLRSLGGGEWHRPTACERWDVHAVLAHLVGNAEGILRPWVMLRRMRDGQSRYPDLGVLDAANELAVDAWRELRGPVLVAEFARLWPKAATRLRRIPAPLRKVRVDPGIAGVDRLSLGYLADAVYPRDLWMHRADIARATGRSFTVDGHDRRIVARALRDLATTWEGPTIDLGLTGVVAGTWRLGTDEPAARVRADALDVMRALAGRRDALEPTLLAGDESVLPLLRAARVVF